MKWTSILYGVLVFFFFKDGYAQVGLSAQPIFVENKYFEDSFRYNSFLPDTVQTDRSNFPSPKSVMFKSLMIPGWGQIENGQIWKVPIIYGMFTGVGWYTIYLNNQYKDYRAAFYNTNQTEDNDFKFGPTPDRLQNINSSQLQSQRNSFRNQRDFMFVVMGLAYGLNALDAYIFAHMRSFDVSDDLSATTIIEPTILHGGNPGVRVSLTLY